MTEVLDPLTPDVHVKIVAIERELSVVRDTVATETKMIRTDFGNVIERHSAVLERIADKIETSMAYQRDSLPINLVMKLFSFFTALVIVLLASIMGIKWLSSEFDIAKKAASMTQEQP